MKFYRQRNDWQFTTLVAKQILLGHYVVCMLIPFKTLFGGKQCGLVSQSLGTV